MEGNKKEDEKKKVGACPCRTTPKEAEWSEDQWKVHWFNRGMRLEISLDEPHEKGHIKRIERLHKEARK